jgi:hypothetical protein
LICSRHDIADYDQDLDGNGNINIGNGKLFPIATLGLDMSIIYNSSTLESKFFAKITG